MDELLFKSASIFINDFRLDARVGVNPGELAVDQPIVVDISMGLEDMALPARSERLRDTIDYVEIARLVRKLVAERHYPLVETLAAAIAQVVLARRGATWAKVRLRKVGCLSSASAAGVEVELSLDTVDIWPSPLRRDQLADPEDVVVVGGGAAGLSACLWATRLGCLPLLLEPAPLLGGQLHLAHGLMTDLPAMNPMSGLALARRLGRQFVSARGRWSRAELKQIQIEADNCVLEISTSAGSTTAWQTTLKSKTVILAMGVRRRSLDIPGEQELMGRGILATAAKDTDGLAGKRVAVVGGGDSAAENALILARSGARVTLFHRGPRLSARDQFLREMAYDPAITVQLSTKVLRFLGESQLEGIEIECNGRAEVLPTQAALVRIGWLPNSECLPSSWLDGEGYVRADSSGLLKGETRVFGAGDILSPICPSVAASFGSGATAARAAALRLEHGLRFLP